MKSIFLIDCPGVVYPDGDTDTDLVLKGVVRIENIPDPSEHIPVVLDRVKKDYLTKTYGITEWTDSEDFLSQLGKKSGRLLKKGEPDIETVSRMILRDWQRGKIPYFVCPKFEDDIEAEAAALAANSSSSENKNKSDKSSAENLPKVNQIFSKIPMTSRFEEEPPEHIAKFLNEEENLPDWDELYNNEKQEDDDDDDDDVNNNNENENEDENDNENNDADSDNDNSNSNGKGKIDALEKINRQNMKKRKHEDDDDDDEEAKEQKLNEELFESDSENETVKPIIPKLPRQKSEKTISFIKKDDSEEGSKKKKDKRMTTNKKKTGSNFYESTNVKNKNRNKKIKAKPKHQIMRTKKF